MQLAYICCSIADLAHGLKGLGAHALYNRRDSNTIIFQTNSKVNMESLYLTARKFKLNESDKRNNTNCHNNKYFVTQPHCNI